MCRERSGKVKGRVRERERERERQRQRGHEEGQLAILRSEADRLSHLLLPLTLHFSSFIFTHEIIAVKLNAIRRDSVFC